MKIKSILFSISFLFFLGNVGYAITKTSHGSTTTRDMVLDSMFQDSTLMLKQVKKELGKYLQTLGSFVAGGTATTETLEFDTNTKKTNTKSTTGIERTKEVFGFHPYWLKKAYKEYDFKLLSAVSYFSYELDPTTGMYETIHDWKTTPLVNLAQADSCKVYLTVTNFTEYKNRLFLKNEDARKKSIRTIRNLLIERQADGVTIDFENVPRDVSKQFTEYVKNMAMALKAKGMTVVVTLPANYTTTFDVLEMMDHVAFFVVMGKNYYGDWSDIAGPVSPLRSGSLWKEGSLVNSVETYLDVGIPENKMILSLPYYGSKWQLSDSIYPPQRPFFIENLKYRTIKNTYPNEPQYDTISETAYLDLVSKDGKKIQVWFDDAKTLAKKYDYINQKELAGVGIWALGYDDGYPELWEVLERKMGGNTAKLFGEGSLLSLIADVSILRALLFLILIIFALGFLLSLRNRELREIILQHFWIKIAVLASIPFIVLVLLFYMGYFLSGFILFMGIALGYYIYYLFNSTEELSNNIKRTS